MAITTYEELKTAVANWLDRTDLTARIPEFISLTEPVILGGPEGEGLRVTRMRQIDTATIGTDNRYSTVPTNFLESIVYELSDGTDSWKLTPATPDLIADYRENSSTAGKPRVYAITGTSSGRQFEHYPPPDQNYTGTLTFYAKPTPLSATNPTNWILDEEPNAYFYGALLQAAPYLRDNDYLPVWNAGLAAALNRLAKMERPRATKLRADVALLSRTSTDYPIS